MRDIHEYMSAYPYYDANKWEWSIENPSKDNELYMRYRARKSVKYKNMDKLPFFDSIEKDADQFGMHSCTFTDIFGITWKGKKGCHMVSDDPDYEGVLKDASERITLSPTSTRRTIRQLISSSCVTRDGICGLM